MVALRKVANIRQNRVKTRISRSTTLPAPFGGWNQRDALSSMEVSDAPLLVNWFPGPSDCKVRKGWTQHVTGLGDVTETLAGYSTPAGVQKLFAVAGEEIFNVTSAGAVGAAVVTGLTNSRFQHINFTNTSGASYLMLFNGVDAPQYYDNSAWTSITGVSSPAITGVTATGLISAAVHKRRVWMVEVSTLKAWYLPVDSVGGAANALDLAGATQLGGYLMAVGSFSIDAGDGIDDFWVGVTSEGEAVVYQGTDPSSVSTWGIVGVWRIGEPIGRRCMTEFKGDLLINTVAGVVSVSAMMQNLPVNTITDKIRNAHVAASDLYRGNFGWQLHYFPAGEQLIVNVPETENSIQVQHTINEKSAAWTKYMGVAAECWAIFNKESYFGSATTINKFWDTFSDSGTAIDAQVQQAYSYLDAPGVIKDVKMVRPTFLANGFPAVAVDMNVDYSSAQPSGSVVFSAGTYAIWDTSKWDLSIWGGGLEPRSEWTTVNAIGIALGLRMNVSSLNVEVKWTATDVLFEVGIGTV